MDLIAPIVALIISILGVVFNALKMNMQRRKIRGDTRQWEREF